MDVPFPLLANLQFHAHPDLISLVARFPVFELVHETLDEEDAETLCHIQVRNDSLNVGILRVSLKLKATVTRASGFPLFPC
jgi:hypothetical protein